MTSLRQIGEKFYVPTMMVPACRSADVTEFLGETTRPDETKLGGTCLVLAAVTEFTWLFCGVLSFNNSDMGSLSAQLY